MAFLGLSIYTYWIFKAICFIAYRKQFNVLEGKRLHLPPKESELWSLLIFPPKRLSEEIVQQKEKA